MTPEELEARKAQQLKMYGLDTIKSIAQRVGHGVALGQGKTEWVMDRLLEAFILGCPYCKGRIYADNPVLDHKEPIGGAVRRQLATSQARKHADRKDNLHIICKPCNQLKGDFSHEEYMQLRAFLAGKEGLEAKLRKRLHMTANFYKTQRQRQAANGFRGYSRGKRFTGF